MTELKKLPRAIFLMGPTAAGKTALAMDLYDKLPCELISVDSALIYRGMDIGTAKPSADELAAYPHHLIDIIDPSESYSAAQFRTDVTMLMQQISERGKIPLLVGGTMMYFNALTKGLAPLPEADEAIRSLISAQAESEGWPAVHAQLQEVDPQAAARLAVNDSQRIQRALEVYRITGKSLTAHWAEQQRVELPFNVLNLAVMPRERKTLHQRIEQRFEIMLQQGFLQEVQDLYRRGDLNLTLPSMRCVGYRQAWMHLAGEIDHPTMVEKGLVATRQLAKRQITWLRSWQQLHWLEHESADLTARVLKLLDSGTI
ncbi:MAG: tRNA (adenosine(37)-N6)-dimethylallyltransferase MiaA [Pseudomonadales bacterium]|nr:tRNA (adenosine(37)-N6)-dimethylallyltransferase MiaA [Pseudomonadales bacterium]NRA16784.1 tRNA (adenosine(37)-N6)-dimethylallyltransferase MiaA [Oceanospirillaceae bacterium]